jgi:CheY-like chemotaxis protein
MAGPLSVLVVDDNRDAADVLAMLVRLAGYDVRVAYDGPAALTLAAECPPDVVLLDVGMPRMDGYAVARCLRALPGMDGALLMAVTGHGREEDRRCALEAGCDHHLTKPTDPQVLLAVLAEWQGNTGLGGV